MQKFSLDNELDRIQHKSNNKSRVFNIQRVLIAVLVLMVALTYSLNASYSVDLVYDNDNKTYDIHVDVVNGYKGSYDYRIDQPSFKEVIDSDYKNAELECNNSSIKYDSTTRLLYGNNINGNVRCTLVFDETTAKSDIQFSKLYAVNDNNGVSYYYAATAENNYISINYMLFRIIRVNGDGSLRLILNDNVGTTVYGNGNYNASNALMLATNWLNNNLANYPFVVENDYDIRTFDSFGASFDDDLLDLSSLYFNKVGFISANEVMLINGSSKVDSNSYLAGNYFTSNDAEDGSVWVVKDGFVSTASKNTNIGVRPVINVRYSSLKGDGTINNPYMIEE